MCMRTEREQKRLGVEGELDCLLGCLHRTYTYKSGMLIHAHNPAL